jgi:uncharacterized protein YuzE
MLTAQKVEGFELSLSGRGDGTLEAAYIRFLNGKVASTRELIENTLIADYDSRGRLIGIEVLAPVSLAILASHVAMPRRTSLRRFLKHSAPRQLIRA